MEQRCLTAIVAADIAGFSRLMGDVIVDGDDKASALGNPRRLPEARRAAGLGD